MRSSTSPPRTLSPATTLRSVIQPGRRLDSATMPAAMRASSTKTVVNWRCSQAPPAARTTIAATRPTAARRRRRMDRRGARAVPGALLGWPISTLGFLLDAGQPVLHTVQDGKAQGQILFRDIGQDFGTDGGGFALDALHDGMRGRRQMDGLGPAVPRRRAALHEALAFQPVQAAHRVGASIAGRPASSFWVMPSSPPARSQLRQPARSVQPEGGDALILPRPPAPRDPADRDAIASVSGQAGNHRHPETEARHLAGIDRQ